MRLEYIAVSKYQKSQVGGRAVSEEEKLEWAPEKLEWLKSWSSRQRREHQSSRQRSVPREQSSFLL